MKRQSKNLKAKMEGFHLIENSVGVILDSIWVKDDSSEVIIKSAFGGRWHFKPLEVNETSL